MMLLGEYDQTQACRPWMMVDVRDTAECHMRLLESVAVQNGDTPEPTEVHPERIQAREPELRAIWTGVEPRNDRMRAVTGVEFRPFDESLRDCVESLQSVGGVTPKLRPGFGSGASGEAAS